MTENLVSRLQALAQSPSMANPMAAKLIADAIARLQAGCGDLALAFELELLADVIGRATAEERNLLLQVAVRLKAATRSATNSLRPRLRY